MVNTKFWYNSELLTNLLENSKFDEEEVKLTNQEIEQNNKYKNTDLKDDESDASGKDEVFTAIPRENTSQTQREEAKDEEEDNVFQPQSDKSLLDRFNLLSQEYKQMVVDKTMDKRLFEDCIEFPMKYHGYSSNERVRKFNYYER